MANYEDLFFRDLNTHFNTIKEDCSLDLLGHSCRTFIDKITDMIVDNKLIKYDSDSSGNNPIMVYLMKIYNIEWEYGHFSEDISNLNDIWDILKRYGKLNSESSDYYHLGKLDIVFKNLYKNKDKDTYDKMIQELQTTQNELTRILNDPELLWRTPFLEINDKKVKNTTKLRTTTKMNCPECGLCIFINSYFKTHKGSKKCMNALLPKPPKKKGTDKIKCCENCSKEDYYGNLSRMKKHRENCIIYKQSISRELPLTI